MAGRRTMEWAASPEHLGGIPRKIVIAAVGAFAKAFTSFLTSTSVHNSETLIRLVRHRSPRVPLITVSNHMSTSCVACLLRAISSSISIDGFSGWSAPGGFEVLLALEKLSSPRERLDDPLMWGFRGFPTTDARLARWVLAAEDICFKNTVFTYFFRLGKCIPITRGEGIYQEHMNEALDRLSDGGWLHMFPEGKVSQANAPIRRLKWGTASLIARAPIPPIVLPIVHCGFEKVMPEKSFFGRRPPFPLCNKDVRIVIGDPIEFDLPRLRQIAKSMSRELPFPSVGWPDSSTHGLNAAAQQWLYTNISDRIQNVMESLQRLANTLKNVRV